MKPGIVIAAALAVFAVAGWYALYGMEEEAAPKTEAVIDKNVSGLFGKITAQTGGTSQPGSQPDSTNKATMLSFEAEPDLAAFFQAKSQAKDGAQVYQAYRAYSACQSVAANANNLRAALTSNEPPLLAERKRAIEEILQRCKGFERFSESDLAKAGNEVLQAAQRLGSVEAKMDGSDQAVVERDAMIALLQSNTSSAYDRALPAFAVMLKNALKIAPDTSEAQQVDFALMLAACESGRDCSANAWPALLQCAYDNYCVKPASQTWQENLNEQERKRVQEIKAQILQMLKTANFSALRD